MHTTAVGGKDRGLALGQAEKWINMSLTSAIGGRVPGFEHLQTLAHVPIDRIVLAELAREPRFHPALTLLPDGAWSRLMHERAYNAFLLNGCT
jgi:hypothetical protein